MSARRLPEAVGPWPDVSLALSFLHGLVENTVIALPEDLDRGALARWLVWHEVGPLTYARARRSDPELAAALRHDVFAAAAENSLLLSILTEVLEALADAGIPVVVLKGAALAHAVYDDPGLRPMSDVDLWVPEEAMVMAAQAVAGLGYRLVENPDRPLSWQRLAGGELQLLKPGWSRGLLELHWSPFEGDWLRHTATVEAAQAWERRRPLTLAGHAAAMLSPEDMAIHLALHLVAGPKFGRTALRTCIDLGLLGRRVGVDWDSVARQAREWRVTKAVSAVLRLADHLVGLPDLTQGSLAQARWGVDSLVSPTTVLQGQDWRRDPRGYLLLGLMTDRPVDLIRLVGRAAWPDKAWLQARYGRDATIWAHWRRAVRPRRSS